MKKPYLLYLSPVIPAPTGKGIAMRAYHNLEALSQKYKVYLLVLNYTFRQQTANHSLGILCEDVSYIPVKGDLQLFFQRLFYKISPQLFFAISPYPSLWQNITKKQLNLISGWYPGVEFEVIHVFRLYMTPFAEPFLGKGSRVRMQLDLDDIESRTHQAISDLHEQIGNRKNAEFIAEDARRYKYLERKLLPKFERVFVCSDDDRAILLKIFSNLRVEVVPNVVRLPEIGSNGLSKTPFRFLFIGSLDYFPNHEGIIYFCTEIIPELRKRSLQEFRVDIVGSGSLKKLTAQIGNIPEVNLLGYVEDIAEVYQNAEAVIVPVRGGGGTRIKILEAFSYKKPVVSTSIGTAGIGAKHEEHILIADTQERFAMSCIKLMQDSQLRFRLGQAGFDLVCSNFIPEVILEKLLN